jgi:hypothetical protein
MARRTNLLAQMQIVAMSAYWHKADIQEPPINVAFFWGVSRTSNFEE